MRNTTVIVTPQAQKLHFAEQLVLANELRVKAGLEEVVKEEEEKENVSVSPHAFPYSPWFDAN